MSRAAASATPALRRALLSALVLLGLGAAPASAAFSVSGNPGSIVVSGTGGQGVLIFEGDPGKVVLEGSGPVTAAGACTLDGSQVVCDAQPDLTMTFDGGNDDIEVRGACFATQSVALGEGTNVYRGAACPGARAAVTGGGGQDRMNGSFAADGANETFTGLGGDDDLGGGGGDDVLAGGEGNDSLGGGAGNDRVLGEGGNDRLESSAGNDAVDGGAGDDVIGDQTLTGDDDQGADDVHGGPGTDTLSLYGHVGGMAISPDDAANDGAPGEGDNLHSDIERFRGTRGNDTFTGGPGPDDFDGDSGADVVRGGEGADTLSGGSDGDQVFGDGGPDTLTGASGDDVVEGGAGTDSLFGDFDSCSQQSCPAGNDQLRTRDGEVDQVNCGGGGDIATVDAGDVAAVDGFQACEQIDRAAPAGGGVGANQVQPFTYATTGKLTRTKGVRVKVSCPAACSYSASIVIGKATARKAGLGSKARTIGTVRGSLLKAGSKTVTVKFSKRIRAKLRRTKVVTATLKLAVKDPAGKTARKQKVLRLQR